MRLAYARPGIVIDMFRSKSIVTLRFLEGVGRESPRVVYLLARGEGEAPLT